jgi:long-chain fatty acid transport protein
MAVPTRWREGGAGRLTAAVMLAAAAVTPVPRPTAADGFRNPFQGAAAIAQGNAFAAQADDPTAIFYNPAGMAWLPGIQISSGIQLVDIDTRYTSPTGAFRLAF